MALLKNSLMLISPVFALENLLMTTNDTLSAVFNGMIMACGSAR